MDRTSRNNGGRQLAGLLGALLVATGVFATPTARAVTIEYEATQVLGSTWRYDYVVTNDVLVDGFDGLTIYFDDTRTLPPGSAFTDPGEDWFSFIAPTDPLLAPFGDGFYDVEFGFRMPLGASLAGFSVEFEFLDTGQPGAQFFEAYSFDNGFDIIFDGMTTLAGGGPGSQPVPAPPSLALLAMGLLLFARRRLVATPGNHRIATAALASCLLAPLLMTGPSARAAAPLEGVDVELVASAAQRISRAEIRYTFDVIVTSPVDAPSLRGTGSGNDFRAFVESAAVGPADVLANTPQRFEEAAVVIVDRRFPFDPSRVTWAFTSERPPAPILRFEPAQLDFGAPNPGCGISQFPRILNDGNVPLEMEITNVVPDPSGSVRFAPDIAVGRTYRIDPGRNVRLGVAYETVDTAPHEARIVLTTNDPTAPTVEFVISGAGSPVTAVTETFTQVPAQAIDIDLLFTTDRSASMNDTLAVMGPLFDRIVDALYASDLDFRATVIARDSGCPIGPDPWVDRDLDLATGQAAFDTLIALDASLPQGDTERLFTIAEHALSPANLGAGGCLEGFLRDEARLAIVSISDEPEQSPEPFSAFLDRFRALKPDPSRFTHHSIVGDLPSGCRASAFSPVLGRETVVGAQAGSGYLELSRATDGLSVSICETDWTPVVTNVASALVDGRRNTFALAEPAVPATLRVLVDGVDRTDALGGGLPEYLAETFPAQPIGVTELVFDAAGIPGEGSIIQADYTPLQCP